MGLMLHAAARTDAGRRASNEDSVFASPRLAAVADGVGGAAAGEVASQAVINALVHLDKCRLQGRLEDALAGAVGHGNDTIAFIAECRPQTAGMSTTLTALALADEGDHALVNIGDSRTYVLRDGELRRLTLSDAPADGCAERLVELALAAGARDNVTVVVADVVARSKASPAWTWR